jgi:hypothetical protein
MSKTNLTNRRFPTYRHHPYGETPKFKRVGRVKSHTINETPATGQYSVVMNQDVINKNGMDEKKDGTWSPVNTHIKIKRGDLLYGVTNRGKKKAMVTNEMGGIQKTASVFFAGIALTDHDYRDPPEIAVLAKGCMSIFNHGISGFEAGDQIAYVKDPCLEANVAKTQERGRLDTIARPMIYAVKSLPSDVTMSNIIRAVETIAQQHEHEYIIDDDDDVGNTIKSTVQFMRGEYVGLFGSIGEQHPLAALAITCMCQRMCVGVVNADVKKQDNVTSVIKQLMSSAEETSEHWDHATKLTPHAAILRSHKSSVRELGNTLNLMAILITGKFKEWEQSNIFAKCVTAIPRGGYGPVVLL